MKIRCAVVMGKYESAQDEENVNTEKSRAAGKGQHLSGVTASSLGEIPGMEQEYPKRGDASKTR